MKYLMIILFCLLAIPISAQINTAKELTTADSVYDIVSQGEWLEVAVYDTGDADTITVWYPYTSTLIGAGAHYAVFGKIMELSSGNEVVGLYGDADTKYYTLWVLYPRAVRFLLSDYASGDVEIKAYNKP